MKKVLVDHEAFVQTVQEDGSFTKWVDSVSPRKAGVQQVFIAELFLVLQILWEIYQIMKKFGFFKAWFETMKVRRAMRREEVKDKEVYLMHVRDGLISPVNK